MLKYLRWACLIAVLVQAVALRADDWFDVNKGYYLAGSLGAFDDGSTTGTLAFRAPLFYGLELSSQYTHFSADDSGNGYALGVQSDPGQTLSVGVGYEDYESDAGYELSGFNLNASLSLGEWESQLRLARSDLNFAVDGLEPLTEARIAQLGLLEADRQRIGFSLAYYQFNWGVRVSVDDYELDRSRPPSDFNQDVFLEGLTPEQRRQLARSLNNFTDQRSIFELYRSLWVTNYVVTEQIDIAADFSAGVDLYFWDKHGHTYSLGFMHVDQVGMGSGYLQSLAAAEFLVSESTIIGILVSAEDDQSTIYSELTLGFTW